MARMSISRGQHGHQVLHCQLPCRRMRQEGSQRAGRERPVRRKVTPDQSRRLPQDILAKVANGGNPADERAADCNAPTAPAAVRPPGKGEVDAPFPVRTNSIDEGSECTSVSGRVCAESKIPLDVLPSRLPDLYGCVQQMCRTLRADQYCAAHRSHRVTEPSDTPETWQKSLLSDKTPQCAGRPNSRRLHSNAPAGERSVSCVLSPYADLTRTRRHDPLRPVARAKIFWRSIMDGGFRLPVRRPVATVCYNELVFLTIRARVAN